MTEKQAADFILILNVLVTIPCLYYMLLQTYEAIPAILNILFGMKTNWGLNKYLLLREKSRCKKSALLLIQYALFRFY